MWKSDTPVILYKNMQRIVIAREAANDAERRVCAGSTVSQLMHAVRQQRKARPVDGATALRAVLPSCESSYCDRFGSRATTLCNM
jgi:hypothetical protein